MRANVSAPAIAFAIAFMIAIVIAIGYRFVGNVQAADNVDATAKATYPQMREMQRHVEERHMRGGAPAGTER